jgi:hypothetical protein
MLIATRPQGNAIARLVVLHPSFLLKIAGCILKLSCFHNIPSKCWDNSISCSCAVNHNCFAQFVFTERINCMRNICYHTV